MQDYRDREPGLTKYVAAVVAALIVGVVAIALYGRYTETHPPKELKYTVSAVPQETAGGFATCTSGCATWDDDHQAWVWDGHPAPSTIYFACNDGNRVTDLRDCPEYKVQRKRKPHKPGDIVDIRTDGGASPTDKLIDRAGASDNAGVGIFRLTQPDFWMIDAEIPDGTCTAMTRKDGLVHSRIAGVEYTQTCIDGKLGLMEPSGWPTIAPCTGKPMRACDPSAKAPIFTKEEQYSSLATALYTCNHPKGFDWNVWVILDLEKGWQAVSCQVINDAAAKVRDENVDPLPKRTQQ